MRKKNWVFFGSAMLLLAVSLIVFRSAASDKKKAAPPTCCKRSGQYSGEKKQSGPGELIIENLSRQFISLAIFKH